MDKVALKSSLSGIYIRCPRAAAVGPIARGLYKPIPGKGTGKDALLRKAGEMRERHPHDVINYELTHSLFMTLWTSAIYGWSSVTLLLPLRSFVTNISIGCWKVIASQAPHH